MNRELKKYINQVKGYMLCDGGTKRKCIKDLKSEIQDYIDTQGTQDIEKIKARFGTPEQIAKAFLMEMDVKKVKKKLDIRRVIMAVVLSVLLIWGIGVTIAVVDAMMTNRGYILDKYENVSSEDDYEEIVDEVI